MAEFPGQGGQMFAGYDLLIGAILALLILMVILGAIEYLENLEFDISRERFYRGMESAVKQPNGDVLYIEGVKFDGGYAITASAVSARMGLEKECVKFDSSGSALLVSGGTLQARQTVKTDVYIRCQTGFSSSCPVGCILSFGKELEAA